MQDEIVDYIRRNRVSTTEVSDCLGKTGVLEGVSAVNRGHFCVGKVKWVYAWEETNWPVHEQIQDVPEGSVVVITPINCGYRSAVGHLVSKYLLLYQQCSAMVVEGTIRDTPNLIKENWPIWSAGSNPVGCYNTEPLTTPTPCDLDIGERYRDAIAVCDDCGVIIIQKCFQTIDFLKKLEWIESQEDKWYECIDQRKWSTFDTICRKKYLEL